jgi:hypothetical protein
VSDIGVQAAPSALLSGLSRFGEHAAMTPADRIEPAILAVRIDGAAATIAGAHRIELVATAAH